MPKHVVVLGGGVAGLSAAHELCERGFAVSVYERWPFAGGKARSVWIHQGDETRPAASLNEPDGRDMPGEHGFRFFAHFYRHLPDTMKRIPFSGNTSVFDNLVEAQRGLLARAGHIPISQPQRTPRTPADFEAMILAVMQSEAQFAENEVQLLTAKLWQLATSCEERKATEYERICWWDYMEADSHSPTYQQFANIVRITVAADPRRADLWTQGDMALQMMFGMMHTDYGNDRVLNAPTNLAWLDPWVDHLRSKGVQFHFDASLESIRCADGRIQSVGVAINGTLTDVAGDLFLFCVPVEVLGRILKGDISEANGEKRYSNVLAADPSLAGVVKLAADVAWMNGIQYYLKRDVQIAPGHLMCIDSPWCLTGISQQQFWPNFKLSQQGDGSVKGILSVDISDWNTPGLLHYDASAGRYKTACECTIPEIAEEVWFQLKRSLNGPGHEFLNDDDRLSFHIDADIKYCTLPVGEAAPDGDTTDTGYDTNAEPLLINKPDRWHLRPGAFTAIPNMFLAADYVRTNTKLATMETANEAARRAVNAIIAATGSRAPLCRIWELNEPLFMAPWLWYDRWRFRRGLPWKGRVPFLVYLAQHTTFLLIDLWRKARRTAPA